LIKGEGAASPCPHSLEYELMDFTAEVSRAFNTTPFFVFEQNAEDVIMLINYFIEKDDTGESVNAQNFTNNEHKKKVERIKVNSQTATGGWW